MDYRGGEIAKLDSARAAVERVNARIREAERLDRHDTAALSVALTALDSLHPLAAFELAEVRAKVFAWSGSLPIDRPLEGEFARDLAYREGRTIADQLATIRARVERHAKKQLELDERIRSAFDEAAADPVLSPLFRAMYALQTSATPRLRAGIKLWEAFVEISSATGRARLIRTVGLQRFAERYEGWQKSREVQSA
ncbi:MAG: hypothetical protein ACRD2J_00190 [Thermoanaerobaculia bacterium]